jgi:hypothetical protein
MWDEIVRSSSNLIYSSTARLKSIWDGRQVGKDYL